MRRLGYMDNLLIQILNKTNMTTQRHLKLHNRATCILEMIERCDYLINDAKDYLNNNCLAPWFVATKHIYAEQYYKYKGIKKRLVIYYADVIERLVRPAMESNARVIGDIQVNQNGIANPISERLQLKNQP